MLAAGLRLRLRQAPLRPPARRARAPGARAPLRRARLPGHLARFLENHDEPRAAATFPPGQHEAAAVITFLVAGPAVPPRGPARGPARAHLAAPRPRARRAGRRRAGRVLRRGSCAVLRRPVVRDGDWRLLECAPAWDGNATVGRLHRLGLARTATVRRLVVTVNYAGGTGRCYVRLPFDDLAGAVRFTDLLGDAVYDRERRRPARPRPLPRRPGMAGHTCSRSPPPADACRVLGISRTSAGGARAETTHRPHPWHAWDVPPGSTRRAAARVLGTRLALTLVLLVPAGCAPAATPTAAPLGTGVAPPPRRRSAAGSPPRPLRPPRRLRPRHPARRSPASRGPPPTTSPAPPTPSPSRAPPKRPRRSGHGRPSQPLPGPGGHAGRRLQRRALGRGRLRGSRSVAAHRMGVRRRRALVAGRDGRRAERRRDLRGGRDADGRWVRGCGSLGSTPRRVDVDRRLRMATARRPRPRRPGRVGTDHDPRERPGRRPRRRRQRSARSCSTATPASGARPTAGRHGRRRQTTKRFDGTEVTALLPASDGWLGARAHRQRSAHDRFADLALHRRHHLDTGRRPGARRRLGAEPHARRGRLARRRRQRHGRACGVRPGDPRTRAGRGPVHRRRRT